MVTPKDCLELHLNSGDDNYIRAKRKEVISWLKVVFPGFAKLAESHDPETCSFETFKRVFWYRAERIAMGVIGKTAKKNHPMN
jgi:hypothetical protein